MIIERNQEPISKKEIVVERNQAGITVYKRPFKSFGGHLPYPPDDCEKSQFIFRYADADWIDLSICHSCSRLKKCDNRLRFIKSLTDARNAYFDKY